ncbi:flagellar assembly peptidoglycan hydrolase FlgJ [Pseudomonas sp. BGr12]|uniref:flagellar assembly peptidoglycan hydrolase FlgJ n=1 Tax=unclassified Pseudomonas TaxID=196821 RepID=UPI001780280F|nr:MULTISPECIES: flagellar assembly peptidoglycan hydrolase FlgJ [unclassified Pseudomonas]MBD9500024.1 flagellar assembly peptidoglycan hydrolase FlgJ [Pseudomonas sp. PDM17]MBD9575282.1 flagellar assembly peptidoglycan hydrolase FlgJ [Pseudomonas sp. PDM23]MBD9669776.1 flagellar assembly peptidoglycan hydrolase FlgJ [Pseudomonas sp. PDM21]MDL2427925.1 flagellar assembly peptidoglycan hydrolase FlgJ [Pseudomonas sp. BJa5]
MDARLLSAGTSTTDSGSYSDLNRLSAMKTGANRDSAGNIRKVAQEFESLFMNEMLKSMRSANEVFAKDNPMNSEAAKQYQDMYDHQLSVSLATQGHGIGLADVLVKQMEKMQGVRHTGNNPFAQTGQAATDSTQSAAATAAASDRQKTPSVFAANGKALPQPEAGRDDRQALNARRLALPGKLAQRIAAGLVPGADSSVASTANQPAQLASNDWRGSRAYTKQIDTAVPVADIDTSAISTKPGKSMFASADDFISTMLPMAERAAKRIGVDPRYLVAQAALETGWGKKMIAQRDGSSSHNLFGIKSGSSWKGDSARATTTEFEQGKQVKEVASFRAYNSFEQSFQDYVSFLQNNDRYQGALDSAARPDQFMKELQRAGYATDPQYARKVNQIAKQMQVYQTVAMADTPTRTL